jgi:hypothetical protein
VTSGSPRPAWLTGIAVSAPGCDGTLKCETRTQEGDGLYICRRDVPVPPVPPRGLLRSVATIQLLPVLSQGWVERVKALTTINKCAVQAPPPFLKRTTFFDHFFKLAENLSGTSGLVREIAGSNNSCSATIGFPRRRPRQSLALTTPFWRLGSTREKLAGLSRRYTR